MICPSKTGKLLRIGIKGNKFDVADDIDFKKAVGEVETDFKARLNGFANTRGYHCFVKVHDKVGKRFSLWLGPIEIMPPVNWWKLTEKVKP